MWCSHSETSDSKFCKDMTDCLTEMKFNQVEVVSEFFKSGIDFSVSERVRGGKVRIKNWALIAAKNAGFDVRSVVLVLCEAGYSSSAKDIALGLRKAGYSEPDFLATHTQSDREFECMPSSRSNDGTNPNHAASSTVQNKPDFNLIVFKNNLLSSLENDNLEKFLIGNEYSKDTVTPGVKMVH